MPTPTSRLGLLKPSTSDVFSTADLAANWQKIDDNPGIFLCTSTTHPAWGAAHKGREIMETDTLLKWIWTGSVAAGGFVRSAPAGMLKTTSGAWARGQRTSSYSTTDQDVPKVVTSIGNVVVPAGRRNLIIYVNFYFAFNTSGFFYGSVHRSTVNGGTPLLQQWVMSGDDNTSGGGNTLALIEAGGLAAGTYNWSFQIRSSPSKGGTSTVQATPESPCEIFVVEV